MVVACGDSDDPVGVGGGGGSGGDTYAGTACDLCDRTACEMERAICSGEPGCAGYLTCLGGCVTMATGDADPACEAGCADAHSPESPALVAFRACRTEGAGTTCSDCPREGGGGAGGAGGLCTPPAFVTQQCAPSTEPDPCFKCQFEKCCESIEKIFEPGPAEDLTECYLACTDPQCDAACFAAFPDGVAAHAEFEACAFTQCGEPVGPCPIDGTCNPCILSECACEYASCLANVDCFLANQCFGWCEDTGCVSDCLMQYPNKDPEYDAQNACRTQRCGDQCGG